MNQKRKNEFSDTTFSKICIVVEDADESEYWLELILETKLSTEIEELERLAHEAKEITKIVTKAKHLSYGYK